ncbi:MAG: DUF5131 family protein [Magnetococcales bacterium]|nr:DUF5131 family protein [Magnetococcales bacterium]
MKIRINDPFWWDKSYNFQVGCSKISEGCRFCYAIPGTSRLKSHGNDQYIDVAKKINGRWKWTGQINRATDTIVNKPLRNTNTIFFANSMSDVFHKNSDDNTLLEVLDIMEENMWRQNTLMLLTKRPYNIMKFLERTGAGFPISTWLGVTVENRKALKRISILRDVPCAFRFLSIEPLLEDLGEVDLRGINFVIVGGESGGKHVRRMEYDWVKNIQEQCLYHGVPMWFKQWGRPESNPLAQSTPPGMTVNQWVRKKELEALVEQGIMCRKCTINGEEERCKKCNKIAKGGSLLDGKFFKDHPCRKRWYKKLLQEIGR